MGGGVLPFLLLLGRMSSSFDLLLSGNIHDIAVESSPSDVEEYLPRLVFYATYCDQSLFRSLYTFSQVGRIQHFFQLVDCTALRNFLKQKTKNQPIEHLMYSPEYPFNQHTNQFEQGTPVEQVQCVAWEMYQLIQIFHFKIPEELINIPDTLVTQMLMEEQAQANRKRDKKSESKLEERKRKKMHKLLRQRQLARKKDVASRLPILSVPSSTILLKEILPCLPLLLPPTPHEELNLRIGDMILGLLLYGDPSRELICTIVRNHPSSLATIIQALLSSVPLFPFLIQ